MTFDKSGAFMMTLGAIVISFVVAESVFFLVKAWKRGKALGIKTEDMKKTVISSTLFTIPPAMAIVATVLALSKSLGIAVPWVRLSVIGNMAYETTAANSAMGAFGAGTIANEITDPMVFSSAVWVMTIGSIMPLILIPLFLKKLQKKMGNVVKKDTKWADSMSAAAFIGIIAAFIGVSLAGVNASESKKPGDSAGVLSLVTLISAIACMLILQKIATKRNIRWLETFAMPISTFFAMGISMLFAAVAPDIAYIEWR